MKITTTRFAALDVDEDRLILIQRGVLGFEGYKRFALLKPSAGEPLLWLQAVDEPGLAFVVVNPSVVTGGYSPAIMEDELNLLDVRRGEDIVLLSIVTVHSQPLRVTANLRAPIMINAANRKANQIVLEDPAYPVQHLFFDDGAMRDRDASQLRAGMWQLEKLSVAMAAV